MTDRFRSYTRDRLTFDVADEGPLDGEVVVLLHGFPELNTCWDQVTPVLHAAGYRTIAPNQRGYSPSARPPGRRAYRVTELVSDLAALVDRIGEAVHLVGHDWGAVAGWAAVSRQPQDFRTCVAVSLPHTGAYIQAMPHGQGLRSWYMGMLNVPFVPERLLTSRREPPLLRRYGGMPAESFRLFELERGGPLM